MEHRTADTLKRLNETEKKLKVRVAQLAPRRVSSAQSSAELRSSAARLKLCQARMCTRCMQAMRCCHTQAWRSPMIRAVCV
jgi:hypothetical protein